MLARLRKKNLHTWAGGFVASRMRRGLSRPPRHRHLLFALCDHYEPLWGRSTPERVGEERVRAWSDGYPRLAERYRDADGRPPRHSFFFPGEEYRPGFLEPLAQLTRRGLGEVELHLHHDGDTASRLRSSIARYLDLFAEHGHISRDAAGDYRYSFIHGNWCLANARRDGRWCGVDEELQLLFETGCYADFTFPSAPDECQPKLVNQIYWPTGDLRRRKAYDEGVRARVGEIRHDRLLMVTGPLALSRRPGQWRLRIESAAIDHSDPPSPERIRSWVAQDIHVAGRPEWVFAKIHTHGAPEDNASVLLGEGGRVLHDTLAAHYNDGDRWSLHYVTAREMYNIAIAAMEGCQGNPADHRDHVIPAAAGGAMSDVYGTLVRRVLYPAWEKGVRRRPILDRLAALQRMERATLDELRSWQTRELAALLRHAQERVPHYRSALAERGLSASDIRSVDDLRRLPILTRQDARASVERRVAEGGPAPTIVKTTGGTTGEPLVIRYDVDSEHWRQAVRLRGFGWAGYRIGDPSLHYWGEASKPNVPLRQRIKVRVDRAIKREVYVDCTPRGDDHKAAVVDTIRRTRPAAIMCYAQAGADLARYIVRTASRTWDDIAIICGAEKIYPEDRAVLEEAFGPTVYETYGCREFMLIATECHRHDGLHVSMENLIVEVLDDAGAPSRPGEVGRVVVTDLHNFGSPLIRYANGDLAVLAAGTCECGRAHQRLASIEGRQTETLRDLDGNPVGGMVFNLLFSPLADEVEQFQAVQHADRSITLKIVSDGELSERVRAHIDRQTSKYLPAVPVEVLHVDEIPLTRSGKRRVVIVEED